MIRIAAALATVACLVACTEPVEAPPFEKLPVDHPAALSIEVLRRHDFDVALTDEGPLDDGPSYSAYLVSYRYSGLKLHAMIAVPRSKMPANGYPIVIANHGYVPEPAKYGFTAEGIDSRPGDYYRSVPELYASRGFIVVIPDYRGHNSSEGLEYVEGKDSVASYAEDVVALMSALIDLENADLDNVFMWSHSMGGGVALRALLATDIVKAASFWSTMSVDELFPYLADLDMPLIIQHSINDQSTDFANSGRFVDALVSIGRPPRFYSYPGADHYFAAETRAQAADRDVEFFRGLISAP